MNSDRGAAALEMALVLTLLCALLTLTAPLAELLQQKIALERVAGSSARFATAVAAQTRYGVAGRRPTTGEVEARAGADWAAAGSPPSPLTVALSMNPALAHAGDQIEVTLGTTVDLGLLGSVLRFAGVASDTVTVTAKAVGRQE